MKAWGSLSLLLVLVASVYAQMPVGVDTLYGIEWINPDQSYLKFGVAEDGLYRITYEELLANDWPVEQITANQFALYHLGEPVYLHASTSATAPLQAGDYLIFYGEKNRGELDYHLYRNPEEEQLNPYYSLHSDTASYYLTWTGTSNPYHYTALDNDLTNLPAAETYVWRTQQAIFTDNFLKEYYRISGSTLYYSHMGIGEGYGSRSVNQLLQNGGTEQSVSLELPDIYEAGPPSQLATRYVGAQFDHIQQLTVNGVILRQDTAYNWKLWNLEEELPAESRNGERMELQWEGFGGEKDEVSIGFVSLEYPALTSWSAGNTYSCRVAHNDSRQFLQFTDFSGSSAVLYDVENGYRLEATADNTTLDFGLPVATNVRQLRLVDNEDNMPSLSGIPLTLNLPETNGADYLILTHSLLRANGDPVQAYADYRSSAAGGNYRTAVVNVDILYDIFGYGVQQHPMAIRNFLAWQRKENPAFEFLFIVGKGREYKDIRSPEQLSNALGSTLFIPTFGFPGSDNLLVSAKDKPTPLVATGRLAATTPAEVQLYLQKIQDLESTVANAPQTIEGKGWIKQVLHLGGGNTAGEQGSIRNGLRLMADTLAQSSYGGVATSFYKTTSDPIQEALTTAIFNRINEGVSMITFFGHSSTNTFDFSIDNPENYSNMGKYPLMLSLGCYSGNIHSSNKSVGERFIFFPNKGAGAFGASRGLGFIHALSAFGNRFYQSIGEESYGATIGEGLQRSIRTYESQGDFAFGTLMEQFHLHGDPALRLNPASGPDYTAKAGSASFEPSIINLVEDSFYVAFDLYNIGRSGGEDSIELKIEQKIPSGELFEIGKIRVEAPLYNNRVKIKLPTLGRETLGKNSLLITLDPDNQILEAPTPQAEINNILQNQQGEIGVEFFVVDNNAIPIWPAEYAIVGETPVLQASTANPLAEEQTYFFELSNVPDFSSVIAQQEMNSIGGVLQWEPSLNFQDSTVYYWRVSPDTTTSGIPEFNWESSSFIYLRDKWGWGQADWGQYIDNELSNLVKTESNQIDYVDDFRTLMIRNNIYSVGNANGFRPEGQVNNRRWSDFFRWNVHPSLQVVVVDTVGVFWRNENPGQYGSVNTSTQVAIAAFSFPVQTVEERANIIHFLEEVVPEGHIVVVYNAIRNFNQDLAIDEWASDSIVNEGKSIFNLLENQGAQSIRDLSTEDMRPYYFAYVKGGSVIHEQIAANREETVTHTLNIRGKWTNGDMKSTLIGPASTWGYLSWKANVTSVHDTVQLKLWGIRVDGDEVELESVDLTQGELDLTEIDSGLYPYLKLQYFTEDRYEYSSPQLDHWHLTYSEMPDLAIDGKAGFAFQRDTLQRGERLTLLVPVRNTSRLGIDSTLVKFTISGRNNESVVWEESLPPLNAGELFLVETSQNTAPLYGENRIAAEVNPQAIPEERYYFNNQAGVSFYVSSDEIHPVANLTFDGVKILDGDLVSAKPLVSITLEDENQYLLLDETSEFQLILTYPSGEEEVLRLSDSRLNVSYPSAEEDENRLRIEWQPELMQDGEYVLKLRGQDRTGNYNGRLWLEQKFEVINESQISHVLPYPNPFTTHTRFLYTLTGSTLPVSYTLQIMTISGRVIREVTQDELGPLQIGTHLTDFVWDGTDSYGDQLATGTYFYRFVVKDEHGMQLKHHTSSADEFFGISNGIGKVVILR